MVLLSYGRFSQRILNIASVWVVTLVSYISKDPTMNCSNCGYQMCAHHLLPWHANETCEEYDFKNDTLRRNHVDNEKSLQLIQQITKACPQCNVRLEKSIGCDHFTCLAPSCGFEFCWQCLAPWADIWACGWLAHKTDCPYHKETIPPTGPYEPARWVQQPLFRPRVPRLQQPAIPVPIPRAQPPVLVRRNQLSREDSLAFLNGRHARRHGA